jgi:fatty acid synthase subunit alpha
LGHVARSLKEDAQSKPARTAVLLNALKHFSKAFLAASDIHALTADYDVETRKTVISAYYLAVASLEEENVSEIPRTSQPVLLQAAADGKASVYALFGGQGTNEVYFDELETLYKLYTPFIAAFLQAITSSVLVPLTAASEHVSFYTHGMDVYSWLTGATPRPPVEYLASVPLSLPLIGLTQLAQYLVACRVAGLTPGEMRARFAGATGHSQGVVSAVCISASDSFDSFAANSRKALTWLFFCGLRGQEAFPVVSLEPAIVRDAVDGGEGAPSPMLSVAGLALPELEKHIAATNKHLAPASQLGVSLHNGPKLFVVTGPPKALYGLVTSLRKVRAPKGLDQSKVPFSQRKPVFSIRFLVVGVPYHSKFLVEGVEKMLQTDLKGKELWQKSELAIPIFNTHDGQFIYVGVHGGADKERSRLGHALAFHLDHALALRAGLHDADPLGEGHRFPGDGYARCRLWPWRRERHRSPHLASPRGTWRSGRRRWRQGQGPGRALQQHHRQVRGGLDEEVLAPPCQDEVRMLVRVRTHPMTLDTATTRSTSTRRFRASSASRPSWSPA